MSDYDEQARLFREQLRIIGDETDEAIARLSRALKRAQSELDPLKQPPPPPDVCWMPKDAIELYHFAKEGRVYRSSGKIELKERATQHILRKTREEAERDLYREQARMTIIRFIARENAKRGWVADWNNDSLGKYYLSYDYADNSMYTGESYCVRDLPPEFYGHRETIEALRAQHRAEYLLWLGVDDD